jgi:Ca2+-binding EF-hand superfamily protein
MTRDGKADQKTQRVKKSETLEVRIPHETKQAFLSACREDGTTASEVVREQVQTYLDARERSPLKADKRTLVMTLPSNVRRYAPRVAAGGALAIGLTALAVLPSAAAPDFKAQFSRLDVNGDGVLSVDEFLGPKPADGGKDDVVIETRTVTRTGDKPPADVKIEIEPGAMKKEAFAFYLPEELGGQDGDKVADQKHAYTVITRHETKDTAARTPGGDSVTIGKTMTFSLDDIRKEEFAVIDANKDGKVSLDEYRANQTAMLTRGFEMLDANSDKSLSQDEYAKIVAPPMIRLNVQGGPDLPDVSRIELPGAKAASPEAIKAAFGRLDANKDGKLSLQEYLPKD